MPVFNAESYLEDAIKSVIAQDYPHWELIIVDDGSLDDSLSIARRFSDTRITVIAQKNRGVSNARNAGLSIMKGDFFCFLDADDVFTPNSLSERLKGFGSDRIAFSDGSVDVFDPTLTVKQHRWTPQKPSNVLKSLVRMDEKCFFGPTWMIRRRSDISYQFEEDLTHGEDLFFYMRYSHLGDYVFTKHVVLKYRRWSGSAMSNIRGLALAYLQLRKKLQCLGGRLSLLDRLVFDIKSRKIVFLSLVSRGEWSSALKYLVAGKL